MLLKNKSNRDIQVTDKDFATVNVTPGTVVEVDDYEGKGYLSNYGDILEKIETGLTEQEKEDEIIKLKKKQKNIEKALNKVWIKVEDEEETTPAVWEVWEWTETPTMTYEEKIAFLREKGVKWVGRTWSEPKIDAKIAELSEKEAEATGEVTPEATPTE